MTALGIFVIMKDWVGLGEIVSFRENISEGINLHDEIYLVLYISKVLGSS
jgi:hypothetical protein